jgi:hypothetical protein
MQTTAPATHEQADATKAITTLRKRLFRWELDHLRTHCAELADRLEAAQQRIDALEADNDRAWRTADSWHEETMQLINELQDKGQEIGLTQSGQLVALGRPSTTAPAANPAPLAIAIGTHLPAEGGTLGAILARPDGTTYGLIVANAEHEVRGQWGEYGKDVPGAKGTSGTANTQAMLDAGSPIAQAVRALTIDGHADWYIPSRLEMLALYEASPALFDKDSWYWSSSQYSRSHAFCQAFEYGHSYAYTKDREFRARPVRSIQLQPFSTSTLSQGDIAEGDSREILGAEVAA